MSIGSASKEDAAIAEDLIRSRHEYDFKLQGRHITKRDEYDSEQRLRLLSHGDHVVGESDHTMDIFSLTSGLNSSDFCSDWTSPSRPINDRGAETSQGVTTPSSLGGMPLSSSDESTFPDACELRNTKLVSRSAAESDVPRMKISDFARNNNSKSRCVRFDSVADETRHEVDSNATLSPVRVICSKPQRVEPIPNDAAVLNGSKFATAGGVFDAIVSSARNSEADVFTSGGDGISSQATMTNRRGLATNVKDGTRKLSRGYMHYLYEQDLNNTTTDVADTRGEVLELPEPLISNKEAAIHSDNVVNRATNNVLRDFRLSEELRYGLAEAEIRALENEAKTRKRTAREHMNEKEARRLSQMLDSNGAASSRAASSRSESPWVGGEPSSNIYLYDSSQEVNAGNDGDAEDTDMSSATSAGANS